MTPRYRYALKQSLTHLIVCVLIAAIAAALVYLGWYPPPLATMLGVTKIFVLALVVDVVCGPVLTFVLSRPTKSRREKMLDYGLVVMVQLVALLWALHAMYVARPVVLAFEKDRYVVVSANEVQTKNLSKAPEGYRTLPFAGLLKVGTREPKDGDEFMTSVELSLAGISPALRPDWWLPISDVDAQITKKAKPLNELLVQRKDVPAGVLRDIQGLKFKPEELRYLPFTSQGDKDWIVVFQKNNAFLAYYPVDGFLK